MHKLNGAMLKVLAGMGALSALAAVGATATKFAGLLPVSDGTKWLG